MSKNFIRSFTLVEVVFVVVIVAIGFMSLLYAINYAFDNVQSTKQRVIAINLAREGMESIYQIRDTNWFFWPSKKDECRLDMNPLVDEDTIWCSDDSWMGSWNYILQKLISGSQQSFYLSWWSFVPLDLSDGVNNDDSKFALCLSWWLRESCPGASSFVSYFREIHWEWVFYKDTPTTGWDYLDCLNWLNHVFSPSLDCWWAEAKEYRFCSKVSYIGQWKGSVELCWIITNFWK